MADSPSSSFEPIFSGTPQDFPDRALKELFSLPVHLDQLVQVADPDLYPHLDCLRAQPAPTEEISALIPGWPKFLSDLVFDVPILDAASSEPDFPLAVLVVENQTQAASDVIVRAFSLIAGRWMRRLRDWDAKTPFEEFGLPAGTSIIVHTGLEPWKGPRRITDLVRGPERMQFLSPKFDPVFWEVRDYTASQLLNMKQEVFRSMAVIRAQEHVPRTFRKVFGETLESLKDLLKADPGRWAKLIQFVMWWSFHRRKSDEFKSLGETARAAYRNESEVEEVRGMANTIAEHFYQQGIVKGEARGKAEGETKGKAEVRKMMADALTDKLKHKFPNQFDESAAKRINDLEDAKTLSEWLFVTGSARTWSDFKKQAGWQNGK